MYNVGHLYAVHKVVKLIVNNLIWFEAFAATKLIKSSQATRLLKMTVFWDTAPCGFGEVDRRFRGVY
jgi:hypothetical protein